MNGPNQHCNKPNTNCFCKKKGGNFWLKHKEPDIENSRNCEGLLILSSLYQLSLGYS